MSAVLKDTQARASTATTRPAPPPIKFPSRAHTEELCRTRANGDNARWNKQVEQRELLFSIAHKEGYDAGERIGYTQGWHWGCACGAVAGGVAVGLLWIGWGPLQGLLAMVGVV